MKTIQLKLYQFDELSTKAKNRALLDGINLNVDDDWWEQVYEDAATIGLKITSFDNYTIEGELTEGANKTARLILDNHGKDCDTYKLATEWFADKRKDWHTSQGEIDLSAAFKRDLLKLYRTMLDDEYDYLTSDEAIADTFRANEWDFTENGKWYR